MNMKVSTILLVLVIGIFMLAIVPHPVNANMSKIVIGFDMAHGENAKYVTNISKTLDYAKIILINESFDKVSLSQFNIIVIGQPTSYLGPDEMGALAKWLESGGKVLWLAGDSDYGSGNVTQAAVNTVAEYVGSHLRVDGGAIYDNTHDAQKFYRVLAQVYPDKEASAVANGITHPILAHGPDNVVYVYDNNTVNLLACSTPPDNVIRIARYYPTAYIADNNPPPPLAINQIFAAGLAPGTDATAEAVTGCPNANYTFIAAEVLPTSSSKASLVIVSGESPYGDYEPTFAPSYYNVTLDGPKFIYNVFKWAYNFVQTYTPPQVATITHTVTETVTQTQTQTTTQTVTSTTTSPTTVTVEKSNTGAVVGAAIIVFIAIVAAAYILKK
ncbi:MAG: GldG family protein [Desulfurococcales archaeon]|nr:GldG family protein [Desulfurococcales archaeon]